MGKWGIWQKIDKELQAAWKEDDLGYKAKSGYHIFRLYESDDEWI